MSIPISPSVSCSNLKMLFLRENTAEKMQVAFTDSHLFPVTVRIQKSGIYFAGGQYVDIGQGRTIERDLL